MSHYTRNLLITHVNFKENHQYQFSSMSLISDVDNRLGGQSLKNVGEVHQEFLLQCGT